MIKNTGKAASVRRHCIRALSTIHFVVSSSVESLEAVAIFHTLFSDHKTDPDLVTESLRAWALLVSTADAHQSHSLHQRDLPHLVKLLDHKSLEVRAAAGACIAILESASIDLLDEAEVEEETVSEEKHGHKKSHVPDINYISQKMEALATVAVDSHHLKPESTKHHAKKDRVKQKSIFREILKTVELKEIPSEKLTIGKLKHEFVGWAKTTQLAHVREVLGTGFQLHFRENDILMEIFELSTEAGPKERNKKMDRLARQEKQKSSSQQKEKQRKKKQAFLHEAE